MPHDERARRFAEAYLEMARVARYRPEAPSDGLGSVPMEHEKIVNEQVLEAEAQCYARRLVKEDDDAKFTLFGCTHFPANRVFVYLLNACTLCFAGNGALPIVRRLLHLALRELDAVLSRANG